MGPTPDGGVGLDLFDSEGKARLGLGLGAGGSAGITLSGGKERTGKISLGVMESGEVGQNFFDSHGRWRLYLGIDRGDPKILMAGERGDVFSSVPGSLPTKTD